MKQKSFLNMILQNTQKPEGFFGRMILRGMNKGHASLAEWGMSHMAHPCIHRGSTGFKGERLFPYLLRNEQSGKHSVE